MLAERPRSDSLETDKGNPMQNMPPMTNLDNHLENLDQADITLIQNSFESPPSHNNTKVDYVTDPGQAVIYEESKEIVRDYSFSMPYVHDTRNQPPRNEALHNEDDFVQTDPRPSTKKRVARGSTLIPRDEDPPRRSKRLESRHRILN